MIGQIIAVGFIALIVGLLIRKSWLARSITHYNPLQLREKLNSKDDFVLLDVRTSRERQAGHIKGSLHIPLQELRRRLPELRKYQAQEIVCYCRSGNRSLNAAAILRKAEFNVANLRGGIVEWNFANR